MCVDAPHEELSRNKSRRRPRANSGSCMPLTYGSLLHWLGGIVLRNGPVRRNVGNIGIEERPPDTAPDIARTTRSAGFVRVNLPRVFPCIVADSLKPAGAFEEGVNWKTGGYRGCGLRHNARAAHGRAQVGRIQCLARI